MKKRIVIVDDDSGILQTAKIFLSSDYDVELLTSPQPLQSLIKKKPIDAVLLDMNFSPGATDCKEGLEALQQILTLNNQVAVIMNTAFGDINVAVEAMKMGAIDFLVKPWDADTLKKKVRIGIEKKASSNLQANSATEQLIQTDSYQFHSSASSMIPIHHYIKKVAPTDASILLMGENGTGKTMLAYEIHQLSKRKNGPFIKVDLGTIPDTLFESELFGHVKGAYTDAKTDKTGKFELASGGTLFLDEITNLSFPLQSKILSAIQFKKVSKVGSNQDQNLDIRLICATNQPIYQLSDEGTFRKDLLYRVNTIEITLPPLRERTEDIEFFANFFLKEYSQTYEKSNLQLSKHALMQLQRHDWPGNIRELRHVMERSVILCEGKSIHPDHVTIGPGLQSSSPVDTDEIPNISDLEKETILKALKKTGGNLSKAARELGLGRTTLYRKMQKLNIQ